MSKLDFRHWVDAVDINLECIYGLNNPEVMLDFVRREETEITKDSLERIIRKACEINLGLGRAGVDSGAWYFEEKSKFVMNLSS